MADGDIVEDNKAAGTVNASEKSLKHTSNPDSSHVENSDIVMTEGPASKRQKLDHDEAKHEARQPQPRERIRGVAPVKPE